MNNPIQKFKDPLDLRFISTYEFEILSPFSYYRTDNPNDVIVVPKGFVTDLASVPRIFWNIFPPHGPYTKAAVIHDYLYVTATGTKKEADLIFKEALGVLGLSKWKIAILYHAVKWFGKGNFK